MRTIDVMADETILSNGRFGIDREGYAEMRRHAAQSPDRVRAIGVRRHRQAHRRPAPG